MSDKLKSIITRVLIFILVWLASMLVMGIIGAYFYPEGNIPPLFAIVTLLAPVTLATLAVIAKKELRFKQNSTLTTDEKSKTSNPKPTYILNPQTMVFHRKSCIHAQNIYGTKTGLTDSRSAAISVGYRPCKYCKP